jgi:hypothetical protein
LPEGAEDLTGPGMTHQPTPSIRFLRVLLAIPAALAGAVVAAYLLLLGWGSLLRIRWVSGWTRQASKKGNRWARKVAGTRVGMLYFELSALHHVGRRSGREYVTPLSAYPSVMVSCWRWHTPTLTGARMSWPPGSAR